MTEPEKRHPVQRAYLTPPPRLQPDAETVPDFGPLRLVGRPAETVELEPFAVKAQGAAAQAVDAGPRQPVEEVLAKRLGDHRHHLLGVSRRGKPGTRGVLYAVAYDYDADVAIELGEDEAGKLHLTEHAYQPAPSAAEMERAIALAGELLALPEAERAALDAAVIPHEAVRPMPGTGARLVEVCFQCPHERLPRHRVVVDLSRDRAVRALGSACACQEGGKAHG